MLFRFNYILGLLKKVFIVVVVYVVIMSLFFHFFEKNNIQRSADPIRENRAELQKLINNPVLNSTDYGKTLTTIYRTISCLTIGEFCEGGGNFRNSAMGLMSSAINLPFNNPPSSGIYWAYSGLQNAGFIPKTYAAEGIGFAALAPFRNIWIVFRNMVFMLFVLIIVAIGFMIMFRTKINPQTVISVENSLPKIVISLILIAFSYAIAGFMIDLMYIIVGFVIIFFSANGASNIDQAKLFNEAFGNTSATGWNIFSFFIESKALWHVSSGIYELMPKLMQNILDVLAITLGYKVIFLIGGTIWGGLAGAAAGKSVKEFSILQKLSVILSKWKIFNKAGEGVADSGTPIASLIAGIALVLVEILLQTVLQGYATKIILWVILLFSMVFIFFRIFFMLLRAYIEILFLVIFSPLILMLEAIPGKSSFSSWIKNLLLNLSTYPILVTLVLVAQIILNTDISQGALWQPPYLIGINPSGFQTLIGGVILFSIPDLVKTVRQLTGVKPLPVDIGIGSFFAGAQATTGGAMGVMGQFSSISLGLNALTGKSLFQFFGGKPARDVGKSTEKASGLKEGETGWTG